MNECQLKGGHPLRIVTRDDQRSTRLMKNPVHPQGPSFAQAEDNSAWPMFHDTSCVSRARALGYRCRRNHRYIRYNWAISISFLTATSKSSNRRTEHRAEWVSTMSWKDEGIPNPTRSQSLAIEVSIDFHRRSAFSDVSFYVAYKVNLKAKAEEYRVIQFRSSESLSNWCWRRHYNKKWSWQLECHFRTFN